MPSNGRWCRELARLDLSYTDQAGCSVLPKLIEVVMEEAASHKIIHRDHVGAPAKHRERIVESRQFIGKAMWKLHWALVLISGLVITAYPQEFHATPLT